MALDQIYQKQFWKAAAARAVHTVAQAVIGVIPIAAVTIDQVPLGLVAGAAALAGAVSLLKSIVFGVPEVQ